ASYTLEYKDGNGAWVAASGCPGGTSLNCRVTLPTTPPTPPDRVFSFRVKATTSTSLSSDYSTETSATGALAAPTWAASTPSNISNNAMTLTWAYTPATGAGPITYVLQYRTGPTYVDETTPSACAGNTTLTCNVTSLTPGATYYFRVKATNSNGSSAWISPEKSAVPVLAVPAWSAAPNPSAISASQMTVGWGAVTGATDYTLEITPFGSSSYTKACGNTTSCSTDNNLAA